MRQTIHINFYTILFDLECFRGVSAHSVSLPRSCGYMILFRYSFERSKSKSNEYNYLFTILDTILSNSYTELMKTQRCYNVFQSLVVHS